MNTPAVCIRGRQTRNVLIFQLDGKIPNIALMRISAHHKEHGDSVSFRWTGSPARELGDYPDVVHKVASVRQEEWGI